MPPPVREKDESIMKVNGGIAEEEVENEEVNSSRPGDHSGLEDLNNAGIFSSGPI